MRLSVPGRHMALNALGALLAAIEVGAHRPRSVLDGLAGFEGVRRRFELVGTAHGVRVFDDYAHHPTEVRATLGAVRTLTEQSGRGRSIVVFQPHLYSRTDAFAREFGQALDCADEVFVLDVYAAREQPMAGVSGATVAEHVSEPVHYVPDFSAVAERVANAVRSGDVVVTMGAGDVTMLGPEIVEALRHGPTGQRRAQSRDGRAMTGAASDGTRGDAEPEDAARRRPSPTTTARRRPSPKTTARRPPSPKTHPQRISRDRDGGPGGNAKRAARPRPAPSRSSRPAERPSGVRRVSRPTIPNPLRGARFGA